MHSASGSFICASGEIRASLKWDSPLYKYVTTPSPPKCTASRFISSPAVTKYTPSFSSTPRSGRSCPQADSRFPTGLWRRRSRRIPSRWHALQCPRRRDRAAGFQRPPQGQKPEEGASASSTGIHRFIGWSDPFFGRRPERTRMLKGRVLFPSVPAHGATITGILSEVDNCLPCRIHLSTPVCQEHKCKIESSAVPSGL